MSFINSKSWGNMTNVNFIRKKSGSVRVGVDVVIYKEDDQYIAYAPALDISGYGDTTDDAKKAFTEELEIFLDYTTKKHTLEQELKRLGWKKRPHKNADFESPNIEDIKKKSLRLLNIDQANLVETFKEDTAIAV
ncbi:MAG: hypothetical protein R6U19_02745 [Bacteroidales bacterium]